ncbi:hypothetical protein IWX75_003142 [Arthrobacter sp. CAN_A6]|uniref:hypothetical protein n=1 Tax=Arthrobacter sp. CAN_A6 TaxID=2787721 RepID=UPI0018CB2C37
MMAGGLGFLIVPVIWGLMALLLYVIIRFGVKHGMRSYYAEAARVVPGEGPADGSPGGAVR